MAAASLRQDRQGVGDAAELTLPALAAPVELVVHLPVPEEQHTSGVAGCLYRMGDHQDGLASGVDLTEQIQQSAEQRRISELRALQAQMNPHFVLNAMNTVNYMALMREEDDIAATVDSIANLMRYSITEPDQLVSIHTEVENIREYISIYTLRFRQKIHLEISADRPDTEIFIPKFTLQPLVENSIRHCFTRLDAGISVFLRAWEEEDRLWVRVTDTGRGADPDKLNAYLRYEDVDLKVSHGFGIRNVNERIRLHFGGDSGLAFSIDENGRLAATLTIRRAKKSTPDQKI